MSHNDCLFIGNCGNNTHMIINEKKPNTTKTYVNITLAKHLCLDMTKKL